jgi:hypothetical protein
LRRGLLLLLLCAAHLAEEAAQAAEHLLKAVGLKERQELIEPGQEVAALLGRGAGLVGLLLLLLLLGLSLLLPHGTAAATRDGCELVEVEDGHTRPSFIDRAG